MPPQTPLLSPFQQMAKKAKLCDQLCVFFFFFFLLSTIPHLSRVVHNVALFDFFFFFFFFFFKKKKKGVLNFLFRWAFFCSSPKISSSLHKKEKKSAVRGKGPPLTQYSEPEFKTKRFYCTVNVILKCQTRNTCSTPLFLHFVALRRSKKKRVRRSPPPTYGTKKRRGKGNEVFVCEKRQKKKGHKKKRKVNTPRTKHRSFPPFFFWGVSREKNGEGGKGHLVLGEEERGV